MKINAPKRLIADDFDKDDQKLAARLGEMLNSFMDEIYQAISKNLNITDNLNQQIRTIYATTSDSAGTLSNQISFKNNLTSKLNGISVIRAMGDSYPETHPFISFVENSGQVTITNITGLPIDEEFTLTILLIAN